MEIENNLNNEINNNKNILEKKQSNFLESNIGKIINTAVDIGIRSLFPNFIEDQIINIKDNLLQYGLKDGIQKTVGDAINIGKSAIGIFTGNFENISQMQGAIKSGGLIDGVSSLLDFAVDKAKNAGLINQGIANTIKQGKNVILNNVENNIEKTFQNQISSINNIEKHIDNWNISFENKDFISMEKEYNKIEKELNNIVPLENMISKARSLENLHILIRNNGQDFNLSKEQIELTKKLK